MISDAAGTRISDSKLEKWEAEIKEDDEESISWVELTGKEYDDIIKVYNFKILTLIKELRHTREALQAQQTDLQASELTKIEGWDAARRYYEELRGSRAALTNIQNCINDQAEDEGLWSLPCDSDGNLKLQPIGEAYLQQELRNLHEICELNIKEALSQDILSSGVHTPAKQDAKGDAK